MLPSGQTKTISVITSLLYHLFTILHNYFPNDLHAVSRCLRSPRSWISHCWLIENRTSSSDTCIPSLLHNDARQQLHKHCHTQSAWTRLKSHIDLTPVSIVPHQFVRQEKHGFCYCSISALTSYSQHDTPLREKKGVRLSDGGPKL